MVEVSSEKLCLGRGKHWVHADCLVICRVYRCMTLLSCLHVQVFSAMAGCACAFSLHLLRILITAGELHSAVGYSRVTAQ